MFRLPHELSEHLQCGGTLVVPTRQRARAVQLAHAAAQLAQGRRAWASADVLSLSGWLRRETERAAAEAPGQWPRVLSGAEEWFLWREATAHAARSFALLDTARLSEALRNSAALAADYRISLRAHARAAEAGLLAEAQQHFTERCRALNAVTAADLTEPLAGRAQRGVRAPWLRGFAAIPPRLQGLAALGEPAAAAALAPAHTARLASAREELETIAAWCHARIAHAPGARLLVVLPGAAGARERLAALIREALDPAAVMDAECGVHALVGIEGGLPLAQLPLIAHALLSLRVLAGEEIEAPVLMGWLRSPYWHSPAASARAALALLLNEQPVAALGLRELLGGLQLAPPRLKPAARDLEARLRQAAAQLGKAVATPRTWAERCAAALGALGLSTGAGTDADTQQTLLRWHELLEEFGDLGACLPRLGAHQGLELLGAFAARAAFRPADEDVTVTISPVLADPVVIYDGIWVAGLSDRVLPEPVQPDPFLMLPAQIAAGIPQASAAVRAVQAQRLLERWRAGADELVLSAATVSQDLELLPSPLLAGLPQLPGLAAHRWLAGAMHRSGLTEALVDEHGRPWDLAETVPGGTRAVTLQSQCPFRAYAELRLGSVAPQSAEPGIAMDQRGRLLHGALQILWERLRDSQALNALPPALLDVRIAESVAQAARAMLAQQTGRRRRGRGAAEGQFDLFVQLPPVLERECRRAERLIRRLCELERTRTPFTVVGAEQHADLHMAGAHLRMRLDRVDLLPEGRVILDYKSGRRLSADWYGERPTHPQLLAYLCALGADVVALATVHVTAREVRFSGLAAQERLLPHLKGPPAGAPLWPDQQQAWRALIERLIRAFVAGEAAVDPVPGACQYCHVIDICRILERSEAAEAALHGDEDD